MKNFKIILLLSFYFFIFISGAKGDNTQIMGPIIGIDIGNTFSSVGVLRNGKSEIISNDQGYQLIPSIVAFNENGSVLVGEAAKEQGFENRNNTIFDLKMLIGRQFKQLRSKNELADWPFKIIDDNNQPKIEIKTLHQLKYFNPEELTSILITKLKNMAETHLKENVTNALITIPTYFDNYQRLAIKEAVKLSGLKIIRMIKEPIAAAMAHELKKGKDNRTVLVLHFGGKTIDATLLSYESGIFEIISNRNDINLGGRNLNKQMVKFISELYKEKFEKNLEDHELRRLENAVEKAKIQLSTNNEATIKISSDHQSFTKTITRAQFELINNNAFQSIINIVKNVLDDAMMEKSEIDDILLIGGSTKIPKVQQLIKSYFNGKEPVSGEEPDISVTRGAVILTESYVESENPSVMQRIIQFFVSKVFTTDSQRHDELK